MINESKYYSIKECAKVLGVSAPTLYKMVERGEVDYNMVSCSRGRTGFKYMIPETWIDKYQKEKRIKDAENEKTYKTEKVVKTETVTKQSDGSEVPVLRVLNAIADRVEGNVTCDELCRYTNAMSHLVEAMNNGSKTN